MARIKTEPIVTAQLALVGNFTTLFTVPANCTARINLTACNDDDASAVTFSIFKVPSAGSPGPTNLVINQKMLSEKDSYPCPELLGLVFGPGETLQGNASVATQVTITGGYIQYTRA